MDLKEKDFIVVIQCDIVKQRCSGYMCDLWFKNREGGFAAYPADKNYRKMHMSCSGCSGRAIGRKLGNLANQLKKKEGLGKDRIVVQFSSCVAQDNYHGPPCPNLDYMKTIVERVGLDWREDTVITKNSQRRREEGMYGNPTRPSDDE